MSQLRFLLSRGGPLKGKRVVVTAGGTEEPIDPVRVITNRSSGKQGYAVAQSALDAGADVTLISAPAHLPKPAGAKYIEVQTASEMLKEVLAETRQAFALIMAAAVADFRPAETASEKIKKESGKSEIGLVPTLDILLEVSKQKSSSGFPHITVGFAAESENLLANAQSKMVKKNLDMIVANDISKKDSGFEVDSNQVTLLFKDGSKESLPLLQKNEVAEHIIQKIVEWK